MIVVGVDGSRAALEAVAWAAREAHLRAVPLLIAHAMPGWAIEEHGGRLAEVARWMREGAVGVLQAAVARARQEEPKLEVDTALLAGDPRTALTEAAGQARLLVVGDCGLGPVRGLLIGSVAYGVAAHSRGDVVIVRSPRPNQGGDIVVGIDGSEASELVLAAAFAEASLRGVRLRAVHAWTWLEAGGGFWPIPDDFDDAKAERRLMSEALAGWRTRYPEVELVEEVVRGHAVDVLRQASEHAGLLVVGSQGYSAVAGLAFGSVSRAMLHHAPCPVMVVRTPRGEGR
ncbi:universal stress protein [Nonomuraea sp. NPDC050310]|uniref:universal stress protein n=1 Tax=Nonomuraea sp. NPDC050310 TaxID=3154935 RepID=UPI0033C4E0A6